MTAQTKWIPDLIVSRHAGALAWLATRPEVDITGVPVKAEVTAEDVRGKHVIGNLPLHLASECVSVIAIEFAGPPPRGAEYGAAEMDAAGARLAEYTVLTQDQYREVMSMSKFA